MSILRFYRVEVLKMNQQQVADYFELSLRAYRDIERGRVKCRNLHIAAMENLVEKTLYIKELTEQELAFKYGDMAELSNYGK